jgi:hypothetical protein
MMDRPHPPQRKTPVTAVDIVLEPDATMIQNAQAANAGLLKNFPKGFALGDEHAPHMSVMGGYVNTADLDKLFAAAAKVLASEKVMSWKLTAFKYYYMPMKDTGLGGILVHPTPGPDQATEGADRCNRSVHGARGLRECRGPS